MTADTKVELQAQSRLRPVEDEPDACNVFVSTGDLIWAFRISRIQMLYGKLHTLTAVDWGSASGIDRRSFSMPLTTFAPLHLDWRSGSSIDTFQRRVQQYFDPSKSLNLPWPQIMALAAQRLQEFVLQVGDLEPAEYVPTIKPEYNIFPLWPRSNRPVIWYGQGETGKGQMYHGAALALTYGERFASLTTRPLNKGIVVVDYEDSKEEFDVRASRIANGLEKYPNPNVRRFDPRGRLFVEIADQLREKVAAAGGCDGYVIDSAIPACGGDVLKPEPVGGFFASVARLGKPTIIIAHETKAENADFPFGSALWRTSAAMTVNFQGAPEPKRDLAGNWVRDLLLRCTKANNVPRFSPLAFQLVFTDDMNAQTNAVAATWIRQIDPSKVVPELQAKLDPLRRITAWLRENDGATISEIAGATGLDHKRVENVLYGQRNKVFGSEGGGRGKAPANWRVIEGGN